MSEGFWIAVFAVGAVQGFFLCGALWVKKTRNPAAARWLAWLVAVFALMVSGGLLRLLAPAAAQPLLSSSASSERDRSASRPAP